MDILDGVLPSFVIVLADILFAAVLLWALITAPWYKLKDNESSHVYFGAILLVVVLWFVRSNVVNGINFHLMATTTLYLMFQWQFAFLALVIVNLAVYLNGGISLELIPANALMLGGIPILMTHFLLILAQRKLPHNFFVFVFVNCFFAAALSMLGVSVISIGLYYFFANEGVFQQLQNFLPFTLMISIPEAALNGIFMSSLIAYKPAWIASFHDRMYITGK